MRSNPKTTMMASVMGSILAKRYDDPRLRRDTDNRFRGLQHDLTANGKRGQTPPAIVDRRHRSTDPLTGLLTGRREPSHGSDPIRSYGEMRSGGCAFRSVRETAPNAPKSRPALLRGATAASKRVHSSIQRVLLGERP